MKKIILLSILASASIGFSHNALSEESPLAIAIHGGAGTIDKAKFPLSKKKPTVLNYPKLLKQVTAYLKKAGKA